MTLQIRVSDSEHGSYFNDDVDVFLFEEERAKTFWWNTFETDARTYFHFPDDCWIVSSGYQLVGRWTKSNGNMLDDPDLPVWMPEEQVYFCVNDELILTCEFQVFRQNFVDFLFFHDDCPILVSTEGSTAVYFTPLGEVRSVRKHEQTMVG